MRSTSVDGSIARGILMFIWGANLAPIVLSISSFPVLDVSLARVTLRFTSIDGSIAGGILIFIGGQI